MRRVVCFLFVVAACGMALPAGETVEGALETAEANKMTDPGDIMLSDQLIAYGEESFCERILQRTGGKRSPIGLVLSGGSARAMAHIGVLRWLEEHDIVPDYIVSNSMGSIVALLYSAGMSPDQIESFLKRLDLSKTVDLTLPFEGGFLNADTASSLISNILGRDLKVEDLEIPVLVVQEDLVTKRQILVCEGDFATVLRASFAIPVYFPAEKYKGHLLIDGGCTNLAPIDIAYRYSDDVIVSTTFQQLDNLNLRNALTALNVTLDIGKRRTGLAQMKAHPDMIWIRCDVEKSSFMDFEALDEIVQAGYDAAESQKDSLLALEKGEGAAEMNERRAALSVSIDKALDNFFLYQHTRQLGYTQVVSFEFNSYLADDQVFLKNAEQWGLAYKAKWGNFNLAALGGFNFRTQTSGDMNIAPALMGRLDYFLLEHLRFTFGADLSWDAESALPTLYFRQAIEGRWPLQNKDFSLRALETFESLTADDVETFDGSSMMLSFGGDMTLNRAGGEGWRSLNGTSFGMYFRLFGEWDDIRPFMDFDVNFSFKNLPFGLFVTADNTIRVALDDGGDVPLFQKDGFRTADHDLLNQGHDSDESYGSENAMYSGRFTFGWSPANFKPSLGELFILNGSTVAYYLDILSINGDAYVSTGLELRADPSLLGMKDLPLTTYIGYDSASDGVVWGIYFSTVLE